MGGLLNWSVFRDGVDGCVWKRTERKQRYWQRQAMSNTHKHIQQIEDIAEVSQFWKIYTSKGQNGENQAYLSKARQQGNPP